MSLTKTHLHLALKMLLAVVTLSALVGVAACA